MSKPLKLNTKIPAHLIKPHAPKMELALPKELSDALLVALGRKASVATVEPVDASEVQAGSYDLQIHRDGPFLLIDRVVAVERSTGTARWQFDVHRGAQGQVENIQAARL